MCVYFIFFFFSFSPLLARFFRRAATDSLGVVPEKCRIGQQGACVCARAFSLFPHRPVVQVPSEIRSLILEF